MGRIKVMALPVLFSFHKARKWPHSFFWLPMHLLLYSLNVVLSVLDVPGDCICRFVMAVEERGKWHNPSIIRTDILCSQHSTHCSVSRGLPAQTLRGKHNPMSASYAQTSWPLARRYTHTHTASVQVGAPCSSVACVHLLSMEPLPAAMLAEHVVSIHMAVEREDASA